MSDRETPPSDNGTGGQDDGGDRAKLDTLKRRIDDLTHRIAQLTQALSKVRQVKLDRAQLVRIGKLTGIGAAIAVATPLILEPLLTDYIKRQLMSGLRDNYTETASTIYFRDGNTDVARELVDQAIEVDERDAEARYLRAYLDGMDAVYRLINLERTLTGGEQDTAHRALAGGEFLVNSDADDPRGYLLRGQSFMALKRYQEAFRALARARDLAAEQGATAIQALALWRLGTTRLERASGGSTGLAEDGLEMADDPFQKAMDELSRSIVLFKLADTGSREAEAGKWPRLWRGIALRNEKGDADRAIAEFDLALEEDPNFALAEFNRGEAYWLKWISADRSRVAPQTIADWQQTSIDAFERARAAGPRAGPAVFRARSDVRVRHQVRGRQALLRQGA